MTSIESPDALTALRALHSSRHAHDGVARAQIPFNEERGRGSDEEFWAAPSRREIARGAFLLDEPLYRAKDGMLVRSPNWKGMSSRGSSTYDHHQISSCSAEARKRKLRIAQKSKKLLLETPIVRRRMNRRGWSEEAKVVKAEEKSYPMAFTTARQPVTPPRVMRRALGASLLATPSTTSTPGLSFSTSSDSESDGNLHEMPAWGAAEWRGRREGFGTQLDECDPCELEALFEKYINSSACGIWQEGVN